MKKYGKILAFVAIAALVAPAFLANSSDKRPTKPLSIVIWLFSTLYTRNWRALTSTP